MKQQPVNISVIARRAGVSTATVSRTLNGSPLVREKTAERVRKVIAGLGYVPNSGARSLSSGRSNLLGVIISDITNPFFPDLIRRLEHLATDHSYDLIFADTDYDPVRLEHCVQRMMERRVDGIALLASEMHQRVVDLLKRQSVPVVALQAQLQESRFRTIHVDYGSGIREAVDHLRLGHSDLAFIAGPGNLWTANRRRELFLKELERNGLKVPRAWLLEGDHRADGGVHAMRKLLQQKRRPTAILCSNDLTALGALKAIQEAGLQVPHDFSLLGFDDIDLVSLVHPRLSTIRIPRSEIATQAFFTLLAATRDGLMAAPQTAIMTSLIVRDSSTPPRDSNSAKRR
ncbi:MAG TPA: LacI family DNA-binding transcriptional regulator [Bryocella sp.]|nr:LacI family DNA-binding transcriptional regulator [Bryocella sp.]